MQSLKDRFNFRLGTTSYIVPADYITNARYLADKVDDIQLIMFESEGEDTFPSKSNIQELKNIAEENELTYSIHFPLDTVLGAEEPLRKRSVEKHIEILNLTTPLPCSAYIIHFNGDNADYTLPLPSQDMERWTNNNRTSIEEVISASGILSEKFCIETLSYPFEMIEDVILDCGTSVCLDIGHLIVGDYSVEDHLDRWLDRTGAIHLHGVQDSTDHVDLSYLDPQILKMLLSRIENINDMVLTIEVFNEKNFKESMKVLENTI